MTLLGSSIVVLVVLVVVIRVARSVVEVWSAVEDVSVGGSDGRPRVGGSSQLVFW
jgi:hypothetical protein